MGVGKIDADIKSIVTFDYSGATRPSESLSVGAMELSAVSAPVISKPLAPGNFSFSQ